MSRARRRQAERRGRAAEVLAALWLMAKGYRVLALRARTPYGEVDLAAFKRGVLAIVEVKARAERDQALIAVSARQRDRLRRAGMDLARRLRVQGAAVRFDLMIVQPWRAPEHLLNAYPVDRPF